MYEQKCANQVCTKVLTFKTFDFSKYKPQIKYISVECPVCKQPNTISLAKLAAALEAAKPVYAAPLVPPQAPTQAAAQAQSNETKDLKDWLAEPNPGAQNQSLGWVIVKDELTAKQTHNLKMGRNVIGRWDKDIKADFQIETRDGSMSRRHCVIEVYQDSLSRLKYLLYDIGKLGERASKNGTFLNEKPLPVRRLPDGKVVYSEFFLEDGDTIQMSITKMVLKTPKQAATIQEAERMVDNMEYRKTIIL